MIVAGECRPVVVPMPDCWTAYGGSQFIDSAGTGDYMTYLCDELVPFVDERFAHVAERDARAVQGKSSGGYGALVLPMLRPDLWGGLGRRLRRRGVRVLLPARLPARLGGAARARLDRGFWAGCSPTRARRTPSSPRSTRSRWPPVTRPGPTASPSCRSRQADGSLREDVWERWLALGPGADARRPHRGPALDARDLARVRPAGRVQPLRRHRDAPRAARARRASSTASSSSRASTAASRRATRRWSPGSPSGWRPDAKPSA